MRSVFVVAALATFAGLGCRTASSVGEPDVARLPDTDRPLEPVDSVAFTFAWPAGLTAWVHSTRETFTSSSARTDSSRFESNFVMEVREHPDGLAVRYSDFDIPGLDTVAPGPRYLIDLLPGMLPDRIVSGEGDFVRLADIENFSAGMKSIFTEILDQAPALQTPGTTVASLHRAVDSLLTSFISPDLLTDQAAEDWNMQVGFWLDGVLKLGTWYSLDIEVPSPLLGNMVIPHHLEFIVEERLPCSAVHPEPDCVSTYVEITPDSDSFADAMVEFVKRLGVTLDGDPAALRERFLLFEHVNSYTLVTEPQKLIPHSFTQVEETYGTVADEEVWKWDEKRLEYTYY